MQAKYVHTNLVAQDWKRLAAFYQKVFRCIPLMPERDLSGTWVDNLTGIRDAHIQGVHLRLPGYGEGGPTLEIFTYNKQENGSETMINRPGFAHIAFQVNDVEMARDLVLAEGGAEVGNLVTIEITGAGTLQVVYMTDPEGNIIELQKWL